MTTEKNYTWAVIPLAVVATLALISLSAALIMTGAWALNIFFPVVPAIGYAESFGIAIAIWAIKTVFRLL